MIHSLNESLRDILMSTEDGGWEPGSVDISFEAPTSEWSAQLSRPTVNLYLYDIREDMKRRSIDFEQRRISSSKIERVRSPMRINLSYMVTAWTKEANDQYKLLWKILELLFRANPISPEKMKGALRKQGEPLRLRLIQAQDVFAHLSDFWNGLGNRLRPTLSLQATVNLDLNRVWTAPEVRLFESRVVTRDEKTVNDRKGCRLGGRVLLESGASPEGIVLRLAEVKGDRRDVYIAQTQIKGGGEFVFHDLPQGRFTLVAFHNNKQVLRLPAVLGGLEGQSKGISFLKDIVLPL